MNKILDKQINQKMVNINQKMVIITNNLNLISEKSILSLSKELKEPYTSIYRNVSHLKKIGVLKQRQQGKNNYISFDFKNEVTRYLLSWSGLTKKELFIKNYPILKVILDKFLFNAPLLLFGSYAKLNPRTGSDIDLCVIDLEDEKKFKNYIHEIELIHKVEINCMFFKKNEFKEMLFSKAHSLGKEILLNHIVIKNADLWYNFIAEVHDDIRV